MDYPKISVVTPSYNQAEFLEATMDSIHGPGYPNLEHIVMDGGSTDGSVDIIKRYEDKLAFWVSEPDGGQTNALASGFDRATGDILCWLNSDDLFEPTTLFEVAQYFNDHADADFVYGDSVWIDIAGEVIKPKREHGFNKFIWLFDHDFIPQPSAFWRHDLYRDAGGMDRSFDLAMDGDLWMRFAERTHPRHVARTWSRMRFYPGQKNTKNRHLSLVEEQRIRDRYARPMSDPERSARRLAARSMRFAWRAATGKYTMAELGERLGTVVGRPDWEARESAKLESSDPE
jgi:glycosyltransferase involved in cell wall biosynthesis